MKTIEIEDHVFDDLSKYRVGFETPSEVIQRLLSEVKSASHPPSQPQQPISRSSQEKNPLLNQLASPDFLRLDGIDRYISILRFLHQQSPSTFEKLEHYRRKGGKRINFSAQKSKIENSGNNTFPKKISETPYYVLTNLSNDSKRSVLSDILPDFGYSPTEIQIIIKGIPESGITRPKK